MLLTVQNSFEVFKYNNKSTKLINLSSSRVDFESKRHALNTRKSFQVSRPSTKESVYSTLNKLESPSVISIKRCSSAAKNFNVPSIELEKKYLSDFTDELNKSSSLEILNINDESELENELSNTKLRRHSKSSTNSIKLATPTTLKKPKNLDVFTKKNQKTRLVQSATSKHKNSYLNKNFRPSSVVALTDVKVKEKEKNKTEFKLKLNEFCQAPKYPRLIAYFSMDAQFAMLKAYEGTFSIINSIYCMRIH